MTTPLLNNRYRIIKTLARGGFGETFLAVDTHMPSGRNCVLKQLKPVVQEPKIPQWLQERFQKEAAILEKLGENHAQIPKLYAYFSEGGNFYLVQEWIDGLTLTEKQQQQGHLSEEEVQSILVNLLPVLDYVHSRHIIHRDVKPDNIILRAADGKPVLIDFGVMKEAIATGINPQTQTALSVVLGTPGYMSSEQAAGRPVYSSDLYSLGLTAIFLLTGKTPQALATDSRTGEILWRQEAPSLHSNLATVIDRAIRFHPRDRFASAKEMLAALQTAVQPATGATVAVAPRRLTPPPSQSQPVSPPSPRVGAAPSGEETDSSGINLWLVLLLMLGVGIAGFALTFNILSQRLKAPSFPDPFAPIDTTPQTFPTIPSPSPPETFQPRPPAPATPEPELSPTPEPEISPIPEPEVSPTPEPELSPTPEPEVSPTPEPETSPTPQAQPSSPETAPPGTAKPPAATPEPSPPPSPAEDPPLPEGN
jgi:serine/threonine-protein kinase